MTKRCRVCKFFQDHPYSKSEKALFEKKCREGLSLRKLELLLEAFGLEVKKDAINRHIKLCMKLEIREQREAEQGIKKEIKGLGRKLSHFFLKSETPESGECQHLRTTTFFDQSSEMCHVKCLDCEKLLNSFSPEQERKKKHKRRDTALYHALRRR